MRSSNNQVIVRSWDAFALGKQLNRIAVPAVSSAWSPRETTLAVIRADRWCELYHGDTGERLRSWKTSYIGSVPPIWSPDGKFLATAADKTVQIWSAASGRLIHTLTGHTANVTTIAWSPDGELIASGSRGGEKTVRLWGSFTGKLVHAFAAEGCDSLAWSPDGKSLASGYGENVGVWNIVTKEVQLRCVGSLVSWSADSAALITRDNASGLVRWWDRRTGDLLRDANSDPMLRLSLVRPDGRFAAGLARGCLDIWEVARGRTLLTLAPLRDGQWLALRPDGHYRGSPGVEKEIVYVVQTDAGQEVLAPDEFAKKYDWKNDPERVKLVRE